MLATTIEISCHPEKPILRKNPLDIAIENGKNDIRSCEDILSASMLPQCTHRESRIRSVEHAENSLLGPEHRPRFQQEFISDSLPGPGYSLKMRSRSPTSIFSKTKPCRHSKWDLVEQISKTSLEDTKIWENNTGMEHLDGTKSPLTNDMLMNEDEQMFGLSSLDDIHGLSSCYSSSPTHFVSVGLLPQSINPGDFEFLKSTGKVWEVLTDRIHDLGIIVVAYFDLRDAIAAVHQLRSSEIKEHTTVNFVRMPKLVTNTTLFGSFKNISDFDGKLLLSFYPPNQFTSNMQLILESCGDIRQISQLPYKSSIVVEFYDIRTAIAAEEKLYHMDPNGTQYQVNFCPDEADKEKVVFHDYCDISSKSFRTKEHTVNKWKEETAVFNNVYGVFCSTQPFLPLSTKPNDSNSSLTMPPGISFGSQADPWSKTWQLKTNTNRLMAGCTPSNMPRYSSNSNSCENLVPSRNHVDVWKITRGLDNRTTFMIRNIPNKYTQKMLLECIDETHKGEYDFVYLRIDFKNHCNVGYAFINFIDVKAVVSFIEKRVGRKWGRFNSDKVCHISYANIQGKTALVEKFRNSSVMNKDPTYQPKIFHSSGSFKGLEEPFPTSQNVATHNSCNACWSPFSSKANWKDTEPESES